jgi:hypothetical protein
MSSPFETLGLEWDVDERTVKRAYAKLIKEFRPDSHPVEFARIREAYEQATEYVRDRAYWAEVEQSEAEDEALAQDQPAEPLRSENIADLAQKAAKQDSQFDRQPQTQLPVDVEDDTFDIPPYQRLHSERISEAELFHLLDSPEQTIQVLPDVAPLLKSDTAEKSLPQNNHYQLINQMLAELGQFKLPQQEADALACFNTQLQRLDEMSLDARMDYEDALGQWMLYSEQPPLRVFGAACQLFGWDADHQSYVHRYGAVRFTQLQALYSFYQKTVDSLAPDSSALACWRGKTRAEFVALKAQYAQWQVDCLNLNLPNLQHYFSELPEKRFQVYVVDMLFALSLAFLAWFVVLREFELLAFWGRLVFTSATFVFFLLLPVALRAIVGFIQAKPLGVGNRIFNWVKHSNIAALFLVLSIILVVAVAALPDYIEVTMSLLLALIACVPLAACYWLNAKVEQPLINIWRLFIDAFSILEKTTASVTTNPYLKFVIRPVIYVSILLPLFRAYLPNIGLWFKGLFKSALFRALIFFLCILAVVIYRDATKQERDIRGYQEAQKLIAQKRQLDDDNIRALKLLSDAEAQMKNNP